MTLLTPHQASALEFKDHLSLTANAGSGKTFVLARRYLNAALEPGVSLSNIAAITFTDKAAGELYNKIVKLVAEQIKLSDSEVLKQKLERIRRQLVSANISTIHSFCINILKEYPVEAGLDARFVPIDEQLSDELMELSIEEVVKGLLEDDSSSEPVKYLIRILGSKINLESELFRLIKQRKNLLIVEETIYNQDEKLIVKHFQDQFENYFLRIWNDYRTDMIRSIQQINKTVLTKNSGNETGITISGLLDKLSGLENSNHILQFISELAAAILTTSGTVKIRGYLSNDLRDGLENEILLTESSLKELSKVEFSPYADDLLKELAEFGIVLLEVFKQALNRYETKKDNEGFLDFEDILLYTKDILKMESVQKSISEKFRYILVDEYQDTNEIQYEIFLPILDNLRSGNLFIVGDEKQSIYMFRDAELEIFNRTKNDISSIAGTGSLLELPDSFRMAPAICLFSNKLFGNLFAAPNELYNEVRNTDIVCARTDNKTGAIEFLLTDSGSDNSISEAALVAKRIINLNKAGQEFKSIAILVRKRKSFAELETEFIRLGIPFSIIGGRGFYQRQTISDIYNYLSFLANNSNGSALVGVLRSPFFNVSDSVLFEISLISGRSFWEKFTKYSLRDEKLIRVKKLLEENFQLASSSELTVIIRKILTDTEYLAVIASRNDGDQELANIEKLINISRGFSLMGFRNLYDFLQYLSDSIAGIEDESQAAVATDSNAVQLMTLHQAKGLEFPVVILFKTHEASQKTLIKSKQISVSKKFGILTKLPLNENYLSEYESAPINGLYNFIEEKKRIAELKRLLYVGMTRAMDHLIISGELKEDQSLNSDSFLFLIKRGLNIDFSGREFILQGDLSYLKQDKNSFFISTNILKSHIPIQYSIEADDSFKLPVKNKSDYQVINIKKIEPPAEKDIISATKVAVYYQCPTKYLLTYEFGFGMINSLDQQNNNQFIELEPNTSGNEEGEIDSETGYIKISGSIKGNLIHSLLEQEVPAANLDDEVTRFCTKNGITGNALSENKKSIISELQGFFKSDIYLQINSYNNYKNEFEVYVKDEGTFLYGIIDKIIFTDDELIIVDYKSDDITEDEIESRSNNYLIQLKFYLFIAHKLFSNYKTFRLILVFIKHPEKPVIKNFNIEEFFLVKREISDIIKGIIHKNFYKRIEHCGICVYSDKKKRCLLKFENEPVKK